MRRGRLFGARGQDFEPPAGGGKGYGTTTSRQTRARVS